MPHFSQEWQRVKAICWLLHRYYAWVRVLFWDSNSWCDFVLPCAAFSSESELRLRKSKGACSLLRQPTRTPYPMLGIALLKSCDFFDIGSRGARGSGASRNNISIKFRDDRWNIRIAKQFRKAVCDFFSTGSHQNAPRGFFTIRVDP